MPIFSGRRVGVGAQGLAPFTRYVTARRLQAREDEQRAMENERMMAQEERAKEQAMLNREIQMEQLKQSREAAEENARKLKREEEKRQREQKLFKTYGVTPEELELQQAQATLKNLREGTPEQKAQLGLSALKEARLREEARIKREQMAMLDAAKRGVPYTPTGVPADQDQVAMPGPSGPQAPTRQGGGTITVNGKQRTLPGTPQPQRPIAPQPVAQPPIPQQKLPQRTISIGRQNQMRPFPNIADIQVPNEAFWNQRAQEWLAAGEVDMAQAIKTDIENKRQELVEPERARWLRDFEVFKKQQRAETSEEKPKNKLVESKLQENLWNAQAQKVSEAVGPPMRSPSGPPMRTAGVPVELAGFAPLFRPDVAPEEIEDAKELAVIDQAIEKAQAQIETIRPIPNSGNAVKILEDRIVKLQTAKAQIRNTQARRKTARMTAADLAANRKEIRAKEIATTNAKSVQDAIENSRKEQELKLKQDEADRDKKEFAIEHGILTPKQAKLRHDSLIQAGVPEPIAALVDQNQLSVKEALAELPKDKDPKKQLDIVKTAVEMKAISEKDGKFAALKILGIKDMIESQFLGIPAPRAIEEDLAQFVGSANTIDDYMRILKNFRTNKESFINEHTKNSELSRVAVAEIATATERFLGDMIRNMKKDENMKDENMPSLISRAVEIDEGDFAKMVQAIEASENSNLLMRSLGELQRNREAIETAIKAGNQERTPDQAIRQLRISLTRRIPEAIKIEKIKAHETNFERRQRAGRKVVLKQMVIKSFGLDDETKDHYVRRVQSESKKKNPLAFFSFLKRMFASEPEIVTDFESFKSFEPSIQIESGIATTPLPRLR